MKKSSFVEGAVIATTAVIITKILGMLYVIPFYKIIGTQGGALYSYAYNIYNIFLGISSAGIPTAISKIISEYNTLGMKEAKVRTFKIGKKIIGYLSTAGFLVMFIFADLMARAIIGDMSGGNTAQDIAFVIRCVSFAILVIPYLSVTKGYIQGHSIVEPSSVSNILEQVIRIFVILAGSFLAYKVLTLSLTVSVGIAVSGAFFGGLAAYFYLKKKVRENAKALDIKKYETKDEVTNKDIIKKIIGYSIPFIIINIATSIYNFTDMVLIIRGLGLLGFNATDAEFIQSAITTWSTKICMIISAFSMGMSVSLIPNIVASSVKKDWKGVEDKMNKAYQIILIISIPCGVGLCILSEPVWRLFYGPSTYGPSVLSVMVISAIFANLYSITFNTMQALNKFKTVYLSVAIGFGMNAILDIPLMVLFDKIGVPSYWGAMFATIIGYIISMLIATHDLKKNHGMKWTSTFKMLGKILVPTVAMIVVLLCLNNLINVDYTSSLNSIIVIVVNALLGAIVYLSISYKMGLIDKVFGRAYVEKILKKLTFKSKPKN
ncbi:MAG TPA: hypothetical protein DCY94_01825 [Firmicutes bacterium]|nr:hypothetical protein [Bacillota bacterium]